MELLTDQGKKYARYLFLTQHYGVKIPLIGKYVTGALAAACYMFIITEGKKEHANRRAKTEVSRMRDRVSVSRQQAPQEVREMRISSERIQDVSPLGFGSEQAGTGGTESSERERGN